MKVHAEGVRMEGNRLAEHWGVRDEVGAMVQRGAFPAPTRRPWT